MKYLSDAEIKARVQDLKSFYNQCFSHAVVNIFSILVWALLSGGAFWPIWVMFASGATLTIEAIRRDIFSFPSADILPFLRKEWEINTFKRLKEEQGEIKEKIVKNNNIPKSHGLPATTVEKTKKQSNNSTIKKSSVSKSPTKKK